jgi:MFS family permease
MILQTTPDGRKGEGSAELSALFAALYFSEGAPIGFLWWLLPTRLAALDVPLASITALTALLVLPWTFKFLWAPLVDRSRLGLRGWIVSAQALMVLTLLPLLFLDWAADLPWLRVCLFAHAVAAATQDVAIDGFAIAVSRPEQRGRLNGWMQAGMLTGRSLFGGVGLIWGAGAGMDPVVFCLMAAVGITALLVLGPARRLEGPRGGEGASGRPSAVALPCGPSSDAGAPPLLSALGRLVRSRRTGWGLAFALTAGAAFEGLGAVQGPLLLERGLDEAFVGGLLALPVVLGTAAGAVSGGWAADRFGHGRLVVLGAAAFVLPALAIGFGVGDGALPADPGLVRLLFLAEAVGIGLFTAASYALLMDAAPLPGLTATRFSLFMGGTNGCEAWAGLAMGRLAPALGWGPALAILAGVSAAALVLLRPLGRARTAPSDGA